MMWQQRLIFNQIIYFWLQFVASSVYCHPPISFLSIFVFKKLPHVAMLKSKLN